MNFRVGFFTSAKKKASDFDMDYIDSVDHFASIVILQSMNNHGVFPFLFSLNSILQFSSYKSFNSLV